jgi:hypothetical protein
VLGGPHVTLIPDEARRLWKARLFEPVGIAANLGYRFYAHSLHRFYNCDWPLELAPRARVA